MLRQRREQGILEPLLGAADVSSADGQGSAESVSRLWTAAAGFCTLAVAAGTAVFAYVFWCSPGAATRALSDDEEEAVEGLRERALVTFSPEDEAHVALLHGLWTRTFSSRPLPAPRGPHWSELGWQGQDPATDLRAAGHLCAACLLYFAEHRPEAWGSLVRKEHGSRSEWEYPCAVAGVNLVAELADALGVTCLLPQHRGKPRPPNRAFAALLVRHPQAFEELFCSAFVRLDKEWLEARAGYMDFPFICSRAVSGTVAALGGGSDDLDEVCSRVERI